MIINNKIKSQVGTIWIGLANGEGTWTFRREYHGTRNIIRNRAAHAALVKGQDANSDPVGHGWH